MKDIYSILAGKGRGDDKFLRKVFGKPSHVNEVEKDAIDVYGLLGEIFAKNVGTGDTNPNTGLPEYDWKENIFGEKKKSKNSPHNKSHHDYKNSGGQKGKNMEHKTGSEVNIEENQAATTQAGADLLDPTREENIDPDTGIPKTIGEMGLGQEALTAEDYQGMTPKQIVEDIFQKQYSGIVPPDFDGDEAAFKIELAGRLEKMPQFKGVDTKTLDIAREGFQKDVYGISKAAGKAGAQMQQSYGSGMGSQMRGAYGAQKDVSQQFKQAEQGYGANIYALEQQAGAEWEGDYSSFLGTLPTPA